MGSNGLWKDEYIFHAYELARNGHTEGRIAKILGISLPTFLQWERKKPLFKLAVSKGRQTLKSGTAANGTFSFRDYIYNRLPPDLRVTWKRIMKARKERAGIDVIESLLAERGMRARQELFIYAWTISNFSFSRACQMTNVSRGAFDRWCKDPAFLNLIKELDEYKKDFFEESFIRLVAGGDTSATIHAVKTKCRDRGYGDNLKVQVDGKIQVDHNIVIMDDLDLSISTRKEILSRIREKKQLGPSQEAITGEVVTSNWEPQTSK